MYYYIHDDDTHGDANAMWLTGTFAMVVGRTWKLIDTVIQCVESGVLFSVMSALEWPSGRADLFDPHMVLPMVDFYWLEICHLPRGIHLFACGMPYAVCGALSVSDQAVKISIDADDNGGGSLNRQMKLGKIGRRQFGRFEENE